MNPVIRCVILLTCMVVYTSANTFQCLCVRTSSGVKPSLITDVRVYKPRPYCNKEEVIVTLKDNRSVCLDPTKKFTKAVLRTFAMMKEKQNMKPTTQQAPQSAPADQWMTGKHIEKVVLAQSAATAATTTASGIPTTLNEDDIPHCKKIFEPL